VREHPAGTDSRGVPERSIPSNPELMLLPILRTSARCSTAWPTRAAGCSLRLTFRRCALGYVASRDRFLGGFTFQFFQYRDRNGQLRVNPYRPGIAVKHMDSKRTLKGFTGAIDPDKVDQIPEGDLKPKKGYVFRGQCSIFTPWPLRSPIAASHSKAPAISSASSTASRKPAGTAS
jgi:hypothetical protein